MKKTLLFFLLLFTNLFYAQVTDIEHCFGNTQFNLTVNQSALLGNLDPAETTISYHLSSQEATDNVNAILQPTAYNSIAALTTIYARIDNKGTVTTKSFNLKVYDQVKFTITTISARCYGQADGTLTVAPLGGKAPYAYSLDSGPFTVFNDSPTATFVNLSAGNHNIILKDALGCVALPQGFQIAQPSILEATVYVENQTVVISASGGTGPYKYSIDGTNYQDSYIFSNLYPGGPYNFRIRDSQGCIITKSVTIFPPLVVGSQIIKPIDCFNNATVSITSAGGKPPYVYAVNKGFYQASNVFTNLAAGDYVFEVKDIQNTIRYTNVTVAQFVNFSMTTTKTDATTNEDNDGTITASANGGIKPYTYTLTDNMGVVLKSQQVSNVFTGLKSGSYNVQVTDDGNCIASQNNISILKKPVALSATVSVSQMSCPNPTGTITVVATGGKAPYKYSANNGNTFVDSNVFSGLTPGVYTIKVLDIENSEAILHVVINALSVPSIAVTNLSNVRCKDDNTGSITVATTGGQGPYMYAIGELPFAATSTFTNLRAGAYNITVKDVNNCTATTSVNISEPTEALSATAIAINDQGVIVNAKGGSGPYLYSLQNNLGVVIAGPKDNGIFTQLPAGTYTAQVTDVLGCGYMQGGITIVEAPALIASISVGSASCGSTGNVTVTATGGISPYSYSLDGSDYVASNVFSNLFPGNYIVSVRDSQNTTIIFPFNITAKPVSITATVSAVRCKGSNTGSVQTIVSQGQAPYVYKLDNVDFYDSRPIYTFSNLSAGNHTIQVTDRNNCTSFVNVTIPEPTLLSATMEVNDKTISVSATGGTPPYLYTLQDHYTGATIRNSQVSNIFDNLPTGVYSVQVADSNVCSLLRTGIYINDPSIPLAASFSLVDINCSNPTATIKVTATGGAGPYEYALDGINYSGVNVYSGLSAGTYTIRVRDSQNTAISPLTVVVNPSTAVPVTEIAIVKPTAVNSNDGSIIVNINGGTAPYNYSLLNSNNVIIASQKTNTFNNLSPGTYSVIVKDTIGCSSLKRQVNLSVQVPLSATAAVFRPTCFNAGIIIITATGGSGSYQYSINNGINYSSSNYFPELTPGDYIMSVRDSENTVFTSNLTILPSNPLVVSATVVSEVTCMSNGIIEVIANSGQAPYSYSINGSSFQNTPIFTSLNPGNYVIRVQDANGCVQNVALILAAVIPITASVTVENQNITVTAVGGKGNYQFSLDGINFQSSNVFTDLNYGTYQIYVRDQNNCIESVYATVNPPAPLLEGEKEITIAFKSGQTLGDLIIKGENIKWYSSKSASTGKTSKTLETPLPLTTLLVDGVTYYASQTIDGIESTERLAVTAKVNGSLSAPDFVLPNFKYYPNPVQHTLTISNTSDIEEIEIIAVSGKSVLTKKINNTHSDIDLSNVASGFYFLKVTSEGKTKTIKIVKK